MKTKLEINGQLQELTPEQEKQILNMFPKKWKIWKPEKEEYFFYSDDGGYIGCKRNNEQSLSYENLRVLNCFDTKQEGERYSKRLEVFGLYNQALELRDKLNEGVKGEFAIYIEPKYKEIMMYKSASPASPKLSNFVNEDTAEKFIELFGEENILRIFNEL